MSLKITIGQTWKRTITVTEHGQGVDEDIETSFVAVFKDLPPEEIESAGEQIANLVQPLLDLQAKLKNLKSADDVSSDEITSVVENVQSVTPMIDRVLVAVEGVSIEREDGTPLSADEVLHYMKNAPKYRQAIMAEWEKHQAKASLGNLLLSGARSRG